MLDQLLAHLGFRYRTVRRASCFLGLLRTGKYRPRAAARLAHRYP